VERNKKTSPTIVSDAAGERLFMLGNEAIARGAIEGGAQVVAAYPGTPSTEIVETLLNHRSELKMYIEWSVNEKVAFGVAMGAALSGARGMAVMKHVGINVALDSIMTAAYIGTGGGLVLVEAEDPGQWSSQNEQDNRYIAAEAYLPVLEPSSAQEAKDMVADAFRLSEEFQQPYMIRSSTRIGHSRGDIELGPIFREQRKYEPERNPDKWVMLPEVARRHRRKVISRIDKIKEAVNGWSYNRLVKKPQASLGVITSGNSYNYLREALAWLDIQNRVSILKIGTPFPLPEKLVLELLRDHPEVLVIEELEPFLETRVKALAQENRIKVKLPGKDIMPLSGEFSTRIVTEGLASLTGAPAPLDFSKIDRLVQESTPLLPSRPPSMCAGCPHRASHFVIKTVCEKIKRETGKEPVRPGDIGCNCLGVNPPLNAIDISTCMGGGFDLSNGIARVADVPVIAHLGDSTFFHSGMAPMVNAVYNRTKITMIVLDNLTTAMTGSQPSPASGVNSSGDNVKPVRPEDIALAAGIEYVKVIDPFDLETALDILEKAVKFDGPSFVVFRRPCAILEQREKRIKGEKIIPCEIKTEKCLAKAPPYCTAACPLHIDIRSYVKACAGADFDTALDLIRQKTPFPGILGRVCTRPCESHCKRGEVDEPVAVAALKRCATNLGNFREEEKITEEKTKKVAIVGGGPAGLMAAYDLRKQGYRITIFEALPEMGGMLYSAIPTYRLPGEVLKAETGQLKRMGIEFRLNTRIGDQISLDDLRKDFDAVFIATGAHLGRKLQLENSGLDGVSDGIEFLSRFNSGKIPPVGCRVVIVGGGNAAIDCARSCLRAGSSEVKLVYRRDRKNMPAIAEEVRQAEEEGVIFEFLANPVRILEKAGKVTGIECIRMKPGRTDSDGRQKTEPVPGTEFVIETDRVIAAIGERPDLSFVKEGQLPIKNELMEADSLTMATALPGVFAGGDVVSGPSSVVEALAAGRRAAVSINRYLEGQSPEEGRERDSRTSPLQVDTRGIKIEKRQEMPLMPVNARLDGFGEVERGFSGEQAQKEAARCLACGCRTCIKELGCPAIMVNEADEVTIDSAQCTGCDLCSKICPAQAISKNQ